MKSEYTLGPYSRVLARFLTFVNMPVDKFVEMAKENPKRAEDIVLGWLLIHKRRFEEKKISGSTIKNLRAPIRLLLEMNDVTGINWKKIARIMPTARRYALDRAPTISEIRALIAAGDVRERCAVLFMVSGGIRLGAWNYLKVGHVTPVRRADGTVAGRMVVYANEPEQYETFITPEAYDALTAYLDFRKQEGEKVTPDSPVMRNAFGIVGRALIPVSRVEPMYSGGVKNMMLRLFRKAGLRREKKRRHEFSLDHGFRKFYKTRCENVMKPINIELLMGHSTGISDSYYRPTEKELLDDYLNAVPLLTVSEVEEVRRESQLSRGQLEGRLQQLENLVSKLVAQKGEQVLALDRTRKSGT
ncbi:MAG: site-specific integrase [Nitrososphaerota archaeon]|nr:site-specific integrase [Nitrososphaerota archaeon]